MGEAFAITEVDKGHAAMVTVRIDPANQSCCFADMGVVEFVTGMSSHLIKKGCWVNDSSR